jgi:small-conductance mechanosensitive channel
MARLWRILRALITTAAALAILFVPIRLSLDAAGYFTPRVLLVWSALVGTVILTVFFYVLARRAAAPGEAEWRILDLDDAAATRFTALAGLIAFFMAFNRQLGTLAEGLYLPLNYTIGQSALAALALLLLLSVLMLVARTQQGLENPAGRRIYFRWVSKLTPFVWLLIATGFGALLAGYLALANYIAYQTVRTAMVVSVLFVIYHLFDATITSSFDPQSGFGMFLRRITGLGERAIERLGLVVRTAVDLVLILGGIPLLILLWTLTWVDFGGFFNTLSMGVKVGEISISPGVMALVLAIFAGGILATKLFNRWLQRRILNDTRINRGVQDSILKGASYAGYIIAAGIALTAAGLDFSNVAIIAGALGVGIGFGLQSIVNNFVSGLIILAERPIRVGDWVSLPTGEGIVRRINVRSTEIETFDSCSIILPNSLLVTEPVRNWTHHDNMGRFLVAVTVDYGSDAEQVRKMLVEAARSHPKVLTSQEPSAILARFGPNGLDFELRAFVADVFEGAAVASDIRFRLLGLFREKGITIAHPVALMQAAKQ